MGKILVMNCLWLILALLFNKNLIDAASKASGKTATKVGLAGIATVNAGSPSAGYSAQTVDGISTGGFGVGTLDFKNEMARLKYEIMIKRNYDKAIRPVKDHRNSVQITIDFTTRQILDLNEKNQVLSSYIYSRLYWKDEFLTWDPQDFSNITSIWLPTSSLWRPDITLYEDTGNRDYTATRMPFVEVSNDGRVRYLEPIVIESSCSVNIADFPFDYQICTLSFVPWTMPTSKVDLSAHRPQEQMYKDIERFFVSTGEWVLHNITAEKRSQNWGYVITSKSTEPQIRNTSQWIFNTETNKTEEVFTYYEDTSHIRFYMMSPTATVASVAPDRVTDLHWSEMLFTLHLRRNSSLYMQSMLFPAILLTTIALLGFYLPPDSGERIGLQITILLTYMVFLLTVGEMFPASSGPYLGLYYVTCMGLLGVNLAMTVVVLHMHYMPMAAVVEDERGPNGELRNKTPPVWIRFLIYLAKISEGKSKCCVKPEYFPSSTAEEAKSHNPKALKNGVNKTTVNTVSGVKFSNGEKSKSYSESNLPSLIFNGDLSQETLFHQVKGNLKRRSIALNSTDADRNLEPNNLKHIKHQITKQHSQDSNKDIGDLNKADNNHLLLKSLGNIPHNMDLLTKYMQEEYEDLRERNMMSEIENEWKAMARTVDGIALKLYLALLFICHFAILLAALTDDRRYIKPANM